MAIEYCNVTTDLADVYRDIEKYRGFYAFTDWELHATTVYKTYQSGYVEQLFENGLSLTAGSDATLSAGEWWYDTAADILYVHTTDSVHPTNCAIEAGAPWVTFKTRMRNDAQERLEGWLRMVFAVPFQKIPTPGASYNSRNYDYNLRRMTALLTCSLIVRTVNPDDVVADQLFKEVYQDNPEVGELAGMVQQVIAGDLIIQGAQITPRESGGWNIYETLDATSTGVLEVTGSYTGSHRQVWKLQIDTAGAPGTATWKLSFDNGVNFDTTLNKTFDDATDNQRVYLGSGLYARFTGTFVLNDYYLIDVFPASDHVATAGFTSVKLSRG